MLSQDRVQQAYADGAIQESLVPVATRSAELGWGLATADEPPRPGTTVTTLAQLKTPFRAHGRVTAGNAAGLNDGATACLVAAEEVATELGLPIAMRLVSFAFAGVDPEVMGVGPIPSTEKALGKAGLTIDDLGAFEINEAFAVQVLAFLDHFGIDADDRRVNPYGGAIALGHPLASSGVRLMIHLARTFREHPEVRYGLTTMCIGLGMGGTVIWENPRFIRSRQLGEGGGEVSPEELTALVELAAQTADGEVVTHALSRDVTLPHAGSTAVLITLDNGHDHSRPNTLGPRGLGELGAAIDAALARDDISAIAITGKPFILAAGADLSGLPKITAREQALAIARIGHAVFDKLHAAPVPTFAFINGMALGGGLEVTLHCDYRTVSKAAAGIALPECFLGMFPAWGGAFLLPNLIGPDRAVQVIIENSLSQNKMLNGAQAVRARPGRCAVRRCRLPGALAGLGRSDRLRHAERRPPGDRPGRTLGCRPGSRTGVRRRKGLRRLTRTLSSPAADGGRQDRRSSRRVRGRGRGLGRPDHGAGAAGEPVRLRARPQTGPPPGRGTGSGARPADQQDRCRREPG